MPEAAKTMPVDGAMQNCRYERYAPKPWRLFKETFEPMTPAKRVRYLLAWLGGAFVFYMRRGDEALAYCVLERGGIRYPFLSKRDFVVSPYIVRPDLRGRGIGGKFLSDLRTSLLAGIENGGDIYAMVRKSNVPSRKAMEKAGFSLFAHASNTGLLHVYRLTDDAQSEYDVYKASRT